MNKYDLDFLSGEVVTPIHESYPQATLHWNRAIEKHPLAIVFCQTVEDVKNAVAWCRQYDVIFKVRSGRHHYEGFSTGNECLVIDVSALNEITLNENNGTVSIGGGVRNRELYEALGAAGYPFPGGGCPTVGVAGFTLGGGWGYSSRLFGLGCDSLVEAQLIDYKGELMIANSHQNADLFWALRGCGGQNFGIVVTLTFNLPEKLNQGTLINFDYQQLEKHQVIELVLLYQEFFKNLDPKLNMKLGMYNSSQKGYGIRMTGLYYGPKTEAQKLLEPFIKLKTEKTIISIEGMSILEANRDIQDSHPDYENYKSSGRFLMNDLTEADVDSLFSLIKERATGAYYTAVSLYGLGGAVNNISKEDTAFYYRDALFILGFQSVWDDNQYAKENEKWFLPRYEVIKSKTSGTFINFPLKEMDDYMTDYYGNNAAKLRLIQKTYDPYSVFGFEQGIK